MVFTWRASGVGGEGWERGGGGEGGKRWRGGGKMERKGGGEEKDGEGGERWRGRGGGGLQEKEIAVKRYVVLSLNFLTCSLLIVVFVF